MEAGQYPDNVSKEQFEKEYDTKGLAENDGGWTTVKLLKTPYLYLVALATGVCNNCTGIVVSNMVGRNVELGMTQTAAIATMSVVAVIGVFGSWAVGVIDEKLGTKKTMFGFAIWYLLGDLCNFAASYTSGTASRMLLYVSIFMIGVGIGGSANFTTSLPTSVFGRHGFGKVNSVLFPIQSVIMNLNFLISGFVRIITGNDLKFIFLAGGIVSLINIPLILLLKDEYKYNSDKKAEMTNKCN